MAEVAIPIAVWGRCILYQIKMIISEKIIQILIILFQIQSLLLKIFQKNFDDLLNETNVQTYSGYKNLMKNYINRTDMLSQFERQLEEIVLIM